MAKKQNRQAQRPPSLKEFHSGLEAQKGAEEKLRLCLEALKENLSQDGRPRFREFWEIRDITVTLFKEGIHPAIRAKAWAELRDLSREARRLNAHLQAQGAFTAQQLSLAIQALEEEALSPLKVEPLPFTVEDLVVVPPKSVTQLQELQGIVQRLSQLLEQLQALREEVGSAELPAQERAQLFKRLSLVGDALFPRRRQLREELAALFIEDVRAYSRDRSSYNQPPFWHRQQIQLLQKVGKCLFLDKKTFEACRSLLCSAWDEIGEQERLYREELLRKRETQNSQLRELASLIESVIGAYEQKQIAKGSYLKQLESLERKIARLTLSPRERRTLFQLIAAAQGRIEEEEQRKAEGEKRQLRQSYETSALLAERLQTRIEALAGGSELDSTQREALVAELQGEELFPEHRQRLNRLWQPISDGLFLQEEERAIAGAMSREPLEEILSRRIERRSQIQTSLAEYRNLAETSSLDFAKAMDYRELVQSERERLSRISEAIEKVQQELAGW